MGNLHESITQDLKDFAESQHVFFVATAPAEGGHVNVSPKGLAVSRPWPTCRTMGASR